MLLDSNFCGKNGLRFYCTYFDRNYVVRVLALIESLERVAGDYHLYALCFDVESQMILESLDLERVIPVPLSDLEVFDPDMFAKKADRNLIDYYLTSTPCFLRYIFDTYPEINQLSYLDADLYFFSDPEPVFDEIGDASVGLVPHNFTPDRLDQERYGKFNVSWLTIRRSYDGLNALNWYRDRCIEWCHDGLENDKFGDQKYLDSLPLEFSDVRLVARTGVILAVWNSNNQEITQSNGVPLIDGYPVICFHFQRIWMKENGAFDCNIPTHHKPPDSVSVMVRHMYQPYCISLLNNLNRVRKIWPEAHLERTMRYDFPALPPNKKETSSLEHIGTPPWTRQKILDALDEFHDVYALRPILDNISGIKAPHALAVWFIARELSPEVIVESGVLRGQSTWLLEQACPDAQIISIDVDLSKRVYISDKVDYVDQDFATLDWSKVPTDRSLIFFDDHQNAFNRLKQCRQFGFRNLIFDDNYPSLQGNCYSLKKVFSGSGFNGHGDTYLLRNLSDTRSDNDLYTQEFIARNDSDAKIVRQELELYYEFPPVFKRELTRWGDKWSQEQYPTPASLLKEKTEKIHDIFWDDANSYTWICYVCLK